MIKRLFSSEHYARLGRPDLGDVMYFKKNGVKRWGKVVSLDFTSEKSKKKGKIEIGLLPFKKLI